VRSAQDSDDGRRNSLELLHQAQQFLGVAAAGDHHRRIAGRIEPQVAVQRFHRMQEHGRLADATERGGDLLCDDAGFADARDEHLAGVAGQQIDSPLKCGIQARTGLLERARFRLQDVARRADQ